MNVQEKSESGKITFEYFSKFVYWLIPIVFYFGVSFKSFETKDEAAQVQKEADAKFLSKELYNAKNDEVTRRLGVIEDKLDKAIKMKGER